MVKHILTAALAGMLIVSGCQSGGGKKNEGQITQQNIGTVNPYLWRATLDTFENMPVQSADPVGGLVVYDWKSFADSPDERIKATVYILDTRLRADGVKVSVFRQTNVEGAWTDASVDPETGIQLENKILERARTLKASQIG
jgi:PBP1b-binding outer membrane lipoprotein LpoB